VPLGHPPTYADPPPRGERITAPPLSAEEATLLPEERGQVLKALAGLPRRRREVLVLRFYLGLSEAEIAQTLGISSGVFADPSGRWVITWPAFDPSTDWSGLRAGWIRDGRLVSLPGTTLMYADAIAW
jgi:hypothetical protein